MSEYTAKTVDYGYRYPDWDKVQTIDDIKLILKAVNFGFNSKNEYWEEIQHLLEK